MPRAGNAGKTYDVMVVGAGPAGGMVARKAARAGFDVLLVEKGKEVGVPVQCGEAMTRFALEENGLQAEDGWTVHEVKGARPVMPNGSCFYAAEPGLCVRRDLFDKWVVKGAVDNGAELKEKTLARGVARKDGLWRLDTTRGVFKGRILVGADGVTSNVATWLDLFQVKKIIRGMEKKFPASAVDHPEPDWLSFYYREYLGTYGWVFPRGDQWSIGVGGHGDNKAALAKLLKFLKVDPSRSLGASGGMLPHHYVLKAWAADGAMIVGDAGGMTNPTFGGGIHAALSSGRLAGQWAVRALEAEDPGVCMEYDKQIRREPYLDPILYKCARYLLEWKDKEWNFLGDMIGDGKEQADLTFIKSFFKMFKYPQYFHRAREFLLIRKAMKINNKYGW